MSKLNDHRRQLSNKRMNTIEFFFVFLFYENLIDIFSGRWYAIVYL